MSHTREKILETALELFSRRGYEAVSMSDIASVLHITKGALYRHYSGKRAILDAIICRMEQQDRSRAQEYEVPEDPARLDEQPYRNTGASQVRAFTLAMFRYWTCNSFAAAFRRMLALERFHDPGMEALYRNYLSAGPLGYMEDVFSGMMAAGAMQPGDAALRALEFYGPMYLLMSTAQEDYESACMQLAAHIDAFFMRYLTEKE